MPDQVDSGGRRLRSSGDVDLARLWRIGALVLLLARVVLPELHGSRPSGAGWTVLVRGLEVWLLVGVVGWSLARLPVRDVIRSLGRARLAGVVVAGGLLLGAHHIPDTDLWPFTAWVMYTTPVGGEAYVEIETFAGDRSQGLLPVDKVLPMASPRPFLTALWDQARLAAEGSQPAQDLLDRAVVRLVEASSLHQVDRVELRQCEVRDPTAAAPATCRLLTTVEVDR